ncbi:MAG: DUF1499 domain-containing protein [Nitrospira sp.]|nr:DUF1499 domain-containing protein [Nitrospira sp.]
MPCRSKGRSGPASCVASSTARETIHFRSVSPDDYDDLGVNRLRIEETWSLADGTL